jgi:UPF0755 protein
MWFVSNLFIFQQENLSKGVLISVNPGDNVFSIAKNLKDEGLIKSFWAFVIYCFLSGNYKHFQPGVYFISSDNVLNIFQIVEMMTSKPTEVTVTIVPGMTVKEIDSALLEAKVLDKESLEKLDLSPLKKDFPFLLEANSLEGFLLPDTYNFFLSMNPYDVSRIILLNFSKKAWPLLSLSKNPYETLIVASLLEKEVITLEDKKVVAGIIEKRLKNNMPLQIDASIVYAVCDKKFTNCPALKKSDFLVESKYNTYKFNGLPPTPISNPYLDSIKAALSPISSNYLYYLSDPNTKKTIFSKTLEAHTINRRLYLGL